MASRYENYILGFISPATGTLTEFPLEYIQADTYKAKCNQRLDIDDRVDAEGYLNRNTFLHTSSKVEFTTIPLSLSDWEYVNGIVWANMVDTIRRDINIRYWDFESNSYKDAFCYMPDTEVTINLLDKLGNSMELDPVRFAFIEY